MYLIRALVLVFLCCSSTSLRGAKAALNPGHEFYVCALQLAIHGEESFLKLKISDSGQENLANDQLRRKGVGVVSISNQRSLRAPEGSYSLPSVGFTGAGPLASVQYKQDPVSGAVAVEVYSLRDPRVVRKGVIQPNDGKQFSLPNPIPSDLFFGVIGVQTQLQMAFGYYEVQGGLGAAWSESQDAFLERTVSLAQPEVSTPLSLVPLETYLQLVRNENSLLETALNDIRKALKSDQLPIRVFYGSDEQKLEAEIVFEFHEVSRDLTYQLRLKTNRVFPDRVVERFSPPKSKFDLAVSGAYKATLISGTEFEEQAAILRKMDPRE